MVVTTLGDPADIPRVVETILERARDDALAIYPGWFRMNSPVIVGGHFWKTNLMVLLTHGRGWAFGAIGPREALYAGQAAFWPWGERFLFESFDGTPVTGKILEGDDLTVELVAAFTKQSE